MIIAVDFEGTLHDGFYPVIGNPMPYAVDAMKKLKYNGHRIIITTCRPDSLQDKMVDFLRKHEMPFDLINENFPEIKAKFDNPRKIYADIYIDNKDILGLPPWNLVNDLIFDRTALAGLQRYLPLILKHKI